LFAEIELRLLDRSQGAMIGRISRKVNRSGAIPANFGGKPEADLRLRTAGEHVK
jgi:hypothetical protein